MSGASLWLIASLVSCQTIKSQDNNVPATGPIKIGVLCPLTGPQPERGVAERNGIMMAIAEWNEKGGVLGRQIAAVLRDTQCDPALSVPATKEMIAREKVSGIIGDLCSPSTIPASDLAEDRNVILISPGATDPRVTLGENGKTKGNVFRTCFIDPFQGIVAATLAIDHLHQSSSYVLVNTDLQYSTDLAASFKRTFLAKGGKIVGEAAYRSREGVPARVAEEVARLSPDSVYIPDSFGSVNDIADRLKSLPKVPVLLGGDAWESADLHLGAIAEGYYVTHFSVADNRATSLEWMRRFYEKYNTVPNQIDCLSYDSTNLLLSAIEKAGSLDTSLIRKVVSQNQWDAITGPIRFDADNNPVKPAAVVEIKGGRASFFMALAP
jgi:branched-chain amino acid transport system substrate-binding protein